MCNSPVYRQIRKGVFQKCKCDSCLGCRIDSMLLWQARCNSEYIKNRSAFVTFTYDDNHLKFKDNALLPTVDNLEVHKYIDNIRHKVKKMSILPKGCVKDFSFFGCTEYGDSFQRPHAHFLFFGLDFLEMKNLFVSTWKNGSIKSLPILQGGIRYVCDYMTKNFNGELAEIEFDDTNRERPRIFTSKGLGFDFFYAHRNEISSTGIVKIGSRSVPVPIYYKNLFQKYDDFSVFMRDKLKVDSYNETLRKMKSYGFNNYDDFMSYCRKSTELKLSKKFPQFVPHYNSLESLGDGYISPFLRYKFKSDNFVNCQKELLDVKSLLCS